MLALILATKTEVSPEFSNTTLIGEIRFFKIPRYSRLSIISVAPLSILSNWEKQINDHCTYSALTYCVYYGPGRSMSAEELQKYDVVITTYQTVVLEDPAASKPATQSKKKKKSAHDLFSVNFKRVILDEAHQIRNATTKMARAVSALTAERRWCLTGTPIVRKYR